MSENRHLLRKMEKLRLGTDDTEDTAVSKALKIGNHDAVIRELRDIRVEVRENRKENEKKLLEMKKELLDENELLRRKIDENQKLLNDISGKFKELNALKVRKLSIREAILGEWKLVEHDGFETAQRWFEYTWEWFSANIKFELEDGKLKQTGGGYGGELIEGENNLYVEDDHVKTLWDENSGIDRYILNGRLHLNDRCADKRWKRVYQRI